MPDLLKFGPLTFCVFWELYTPGFLPVYLVRSAPCTASDLSDWLCYLQASYLLVLSIIFLAFPGQAPCFISINCCWLESDSVFLIKLFCRCRSLIMVQYTKGIYLEYCNITLRSINIFFIIFVGVFVIF